jgi:hypothetical protein
MAETKKTTAEATKEIPMVSIKIPRGKKTDGDLHVWVNDKQYTMKRGMTHTVPENVAKIIERKEKMLYDAELFEEALQDKSKKIV